MDSSPVAVPSAVIFKYPLYCLLRRGKFSGQPGRPIISSGEKTASANEKKLKMLIICKSMIMDLKQACVAPVGVKI